MDERVILITGALTGIGRAAAVAFAKKGAKVVVSGRRDDAGEALVEELRSFGSEAEFIKAHVRKEEDVRVLVDATVARFGHLDVAVNNAGTEGRPGAIADQTADSVAATFETAESGIRVNAVAPGPTDTGMLTRFTGTPENKAELVTEVPMARLGLSDELANAIVFIASDDASFITGHILNVDGGHSAN
jgi:NAD(P)-dependent dehydrogenase (short-subunit alcohol dehydrogenase family)